MLRCSVLVLTILFSSSLFAVGHDLTTSPPTANQLSPLVTGNGSGFTAAWMELALTRYVAVTAVASEEGQPVDSAGTAIAFVQSMAIAHSPSDTLIAWTADGNVFAQRLSPSGMPLNTEIVLTSAKTSPEDVAVAWNGSRYFIVWSTQFQLLGAFMAPDGSATPPRIFFSEPSVSGQQPAEFARTPDVAWDGRNFIIVFGETPNIPCTESACPSPPPGEDNFRVMRVSADGDAIDSSPLTISGIHLRAHVASSGAESLIALDSFGQVSTLIAHDEGGLTLEAETPPLFRWFSDMSSAVVWDGAMYTVGWRYVGGDVDPSWMGAAHVTRSGLPFDYCFAATGSPLPYGGTVTWGRPSIAVNEAGITTFAISEATAPSSLARARLYLASELTPMPAPPAAPRNVVSYFGGNTARIDWQQSESPAGFELEWSWDFGKTWNFYKTVAGDTRTTTVYAAIGNQFRVRAFGPGGVSEGTITSIGSMQRRRAMRP